MRFHNGSITMKKKDFLRAKCRVTSAIAAAAVMVPATASAR